MKFGFEYFLFITFLPISLLNGLKLNVDDVVLETRNIDKSVIGKHPSLCRIAGLNCTAFEFCCKRTGCNEFSCCSIKERISKKSNSQNSDLKTGSLFSNRYGPSFWNIWYFWFAIILILATCFTGCNYWRSQNYTTQWHMRGIREGFSAPIRAQLGSARQVTSADGQSRIVIPVTMYELPPEALLRMMTEHDRVIQQQQQILYRAPSYNEVTSKPELYRTSPCYVECNAQNDIGAPPPYDTITNDQNTTATTSDLTDAQINPTNSNVGDKETEERTNSSE